VFLIRINDPDQDPAFKAEYQSGSRVSMHKKFNKFAAENFLKIFFDKKLQFTHP
jgi:hypothetical protein